MAFSCFQFLVYVVLATPTMIAPVTVKRSFLFNPNGPLAKVVPSLSIIAACVAANGTSDYKAVYEAHICAVYSRRETRIGKQAAKYGVASTVRYFKQKF